MPHRVYPITVVNTGFCNWQLLYLAAAMRTPAPFVFTFRNRCVAVMGTFTVQFFQNVSLTSDFERRYKKQTELVVCQT